MTTREFIGARAAAAYEDLFDLPARESRTLFLTRRGYVRHRRLSASDVEFGSYLHNAGRDDVVADALEAWEEIERDREREGVRA